MITDIIQTSNNALSNGGNLPLIKSSAAEDNPDSGIEFHVGMCFKLHGKSYRCINVTPVYLTLCEMDCTRLNIIRLSIRSVLRHILNNEAEIIAAEPSVLDVREINEKFRDEFCYRRKVINRIVNEYGPDFFDLNGRNPKPVLKEILDEKRISRKPLHRLLLRYLQSGMTDRALADRRWIRYIDQKCCRNENKEEIAPKSKMELNFNWGIDYFKDKKGKASITDAYLQMSWKFYSRIYVDGEKIRQKLLPKNERPTYKQFLYYFNKNVSKKEMEIIKTSHTEYRNNERILSGSSETGVYGCYDMLEMDACEVDLSLITENNQTVGRPIIYVLVDVATRAVVAATASFENNSINGLMSCLCNLNENKKELLAKHGIEEFDPRAWLTGYKPRSIRMDNGADFKSKIVGDVLRSFGIERILVSPGTGSLKGVVERSFRDFQEKISPSTADCGQISSSYGSNHHRKAMLTIDEFRAMLYNWVLCHNTIVNEGIDLSSDMIRAEIPPVPCEVMEYLLKAKSPLRFPSGDEFRMKILSKGTANINRNGIVFHKLRYFPKYNQEMLDLIEERRVSNEKKLNILYDPLCIDKLYYVLDGHLIAIPLNEQADRQSSLLGMTLNEVDALFDKKKAITAKARERTEQNRAKMMAQNDEIVEKANQNKYADPKNMRANRAVEKQRISRDDALSKRFSPGAETQTEPPALPAAVKAIPKPVESVEIKEPQIQPKRKLTREEKIAKIGELANGYYKE